MKKQYVVLLPMLDAELSAKYRPDHLAYLEKKYEEGVLKAYGRFVDGWGGMLVYEAENEEQVKAWAEEDPYVVQKARGCEIHEWAIAKANLQA
ncbi:YciI family protein [Paenibacillus sp.]|uniref:YciI family protein n=1 Tax=Paenibacillus sp. TaxID=58172 RepID=UPI002D482818|nr:YciI family protein [Paenibacillus sp.]HZG57163.1 YciI family protein [Paenibacillus sp.]